VQDARVLFVTATTRNVPPAGHAGVLPRQRRTCEAGSHSICVYYENVSFRVPSPLNSVDLDGRCFTLPMSPCLTAIKRTRWAITCAYWGVKFSVVTTDVRGRLAPHPPDICNPTRPKVAPQILLGRSHNLTSKSERSWNTPVVAVLHAEYQQMSG
jgi:hypothetical protein